MVNADDLSTEGFGPLCWVLRNPDLSQHGMARTGAVWHGPAQHGMVTAADGSTGGFGSHCCSLWRVDEVWPVGVRRGYAGLGTASTGTVRHIKDCRRQYGGFSLPTVLSGTGMVRRGPAMQVAVGLGAAR